MMMILQQLVDDSLVLDKNAINLKSLKVFAGTGEPQKADMTLDVYGEGKRNIRNWRWSSRCYF